MNIISVVLPLADRAEDRRHADIVDMWHVVERGAAIGAEARERACPNGPCRLAGREILERRETGEIARIDRTGPGAPLDVAGQLGPEGGLHADAFLQHHGADIGQARAGAGAAIGRTGLQIIAIDGEAQMMRAHDELVAGERVLGLRKLRRSWVTALSPELAIWLDFID